jgi:hypothetical protein
MSGSFFLQLLVTVTCNFFAFFILNFFLFHCTEAMATVVLFGSSTGTSTLPDTESDWPYVHSNLRKGNNY